MVESSLLGALTDRKGQGGGVDGTISQAPDLEGQRSLRRRGRGAMGTSPRLPPVLYTSSASGHTVEDPVMSVQLATAPASPCVLQNSSQILSKTPLPSLSQHPFTLESKSQASTLKVLPPLVFRQLLGSSKFNAPHSPP